MRWKEGRTGVNEAKSVVGEKKGKRLREFPSDDDFWGGVMRRVVKI